jgi:predicted transglutaminase-like cysteine proteinase
MRLAIRPKASKRRLGPLRLVMILVVGVAGLAAQPASAGRDYGFEDERSPIGQTGNPVQELFHTRAIAIPANRFRDKWDGLLKSLRATSVFEMCGGAKVACSGAANRWLSYLSAIRTLPKTEQIVLVNRYINWHIKYANDKSAYGAKDYWATPLQSIGGRGDCEDFASAKYFSLISLGFSDDQMRVVIVRDLNIGEIHAVMTISIGGQIYVLDNRSERVLRDSDVLSMYRPIYSFNQSQNWMHMSRSS